MRFLIVGSASLRRLPWMGGLPKDPAAPSALLGFPIFELSKASF